MSITQLTVPGITCDACESAMHGALDDLPGVAEVGVDLAGKLVRVEHDPSRTAPGALTAAVHEQGYDVTACEAGAR